VTTGSELSFVGLITSTRRIRATYDASITLPTRHWSLFIATRPSDLQALALRDNDGFLYTKTQWAHTRVLRELEYAGSPLSLALIDSS